MNYTAGSGVTVYCTHPTKVYYIENFGWRWDGFMWHREKGNKE